VFNVLLGLRFALELALFAVVWWLGAGLSTSAPLSWVLAIGGAGAVVAVWGVLLSPRRRVDLPLPARAGIELVLFTAAALGLAASGHLVWAAVLLGSEVVVVVALWALGFPPGADAAAPRTVRPGP
jgi:hypothetical protein